MKFIPLRDGTKFKTRAVIEAVAGGPAPQDVAEMRKRCRILEALEKATTTEMLIEDADHAHLVKLVTAFQFGMAHPELLSIIDEIIEAKEPSAIMTVANGKADDGRAT
jgi:hypothetical protein